MNAELIKSPRRAIRAYCLYCTCNKSEEVTTCDADGANPYFEACEFHRYRFGKGRASVKVIRKFCLQCMGGSSDMVKECDVDDCLVFPFRFGKNPNRIGKGYFADQAKIKRETEAT